MVDVRTAPEYTFGHLQGALNIDAHTRDLDAIVSGLDKQARYYLYCSSGRRSQQVVARLQRRGFKHVYNAGALSDLAVAGIPFSRTT